MTEFQRAEQEQKSQVLKLSPYFNKETGVALIGLDNFQLDTNRFKKEVQEFEVLPKQEFHVTVVGSEVGRLIKKRLSALGVSGDEIEENIKKLFLEGSWRVFLKPEWYFIEKSYPASEKDQNQPEERRKSIIQAVEVPQLQDFYERLNKSLKSNIPLPFPHITLYTSSTKPEKMLRGIGVNSIEEFEDLHPIRLK